MWQFLENLENSNFAEFIRSSSLPLYSTILAFHTIGLAFLVGLSAMVALRVFGFAPRLPLAPLQKFFPLIVIGFWVNVASGLVLTTLAAVRFLSNPDFYIKMVAIVGAVISLRMMWRSVFGKGGQPIREPLPAKARGWATAMLICWAIAITAGRLTAYDSYLEIRSAAAVLVFSTLVVLGRYIGARLFGSARQSRVVTSTN